MNIEQFILEKADHLITFLSSIKSIKENELAFSALPSFRDVLWIKDFCSATYKDWKENKEQHLSKLIQGGNMRDEDFTKEQRDKFLQYIECFMEIINSLH